MDSSLISSLIGSKALTDYQGSTSILKVPKPPKIFFSPSNSDKILATSSKED
jgi:hypothetical protein